MKESLIWVSFLITTTILEISNGQWTPKIVDGPRVLVSHHIDVAEGLTEILPSNNNVAAIVFEGRLFMAWRSAPTHFASAETRMFVVSSEDMGVTWSKELTIMVEKDMREPYFLSINGTLLFYYFEAGTNPIAFEPSRLQRRLYLGQDRGWSSAEAWGQESEVAWQYHVQDGDNLGYTISYAGDHYSLTQLGQVSLHLNYTDDGLVWKPIGNSPFYIGGISEVGWAFDNDRVIWGVGRNEDGDETGWGSRIFYFDMESMPGPVWTSNVSNPHIYESPRMFNHEGELYLVARTDPTGPFMSSNNGVLPPTLHHLYDLAAYSLRPHGTAMWKLNRDTAELEWLLDLPGCGDTAFPSIVRTGNHAFEILNYSNPMDKCEDWPWIWGQVSPEGTLIYAVSVAFERQSIV